MLMDHKLNSSGQLDHYTYTARYQVSYTTTLTRTILSSNITIHPQAASIALVHDVLHEPSPTASHCSYSPPSIFATENCFSNFSASLVSHMHIFISTHDAHLPTTPHLYQGIQITNYHLLMISEKGLLTLTFIYFQFS